MGYGILTTEVDWADEFYIYGFYLLNEKENEIYCKVKDDPKWLNHSFEWYFGTNEGFSKGDFKGSDIEYQQITKEEYDCIAKILCVKYREHGQFPNIFDWIEKFLEGQR